MSTPKNKPKPSTWWGSFTLDTDQAACWELGPSTIWLHRVAQEWRVAYHAVRANYDKTTRTTLPASLSEMERFIGENEKQVKVSRFNFKKTDNQIIVQPLLADRSVIVEPETPFYVFPKEEITLYFASPAWVRIEVGSTRKALIEVPTLRPSDTWFGPSTIQGELCYALRSRAMLEFEPLAEFSYRIITPVRVRNRADDMLELDRFQVLIQHLSVFQASQTLWTSSLTIEREKSGDMAAMQVGNGAPKEAGEATLLQPPRQNASTNLIFRAFGGLFQ